MKNDSQQHLDYFKVHALERDPFDLNDTERFFYKTPELEHQLELISHLAVFSDRIIHIWGLNGSGKSTLFHQLKRLLTDLNVLAFSVTSEETPSCLLVQIAQSLQLSNIEQSNDDELFNKITLAVNKAEDKGKTTVLMIDDAHLLSIECLELLFRLAVNQQQKILCHLIIFTNQHLRNTISHPNVFYIHSIELNGLSKQQIKPYLEYRLESVNFRGDFLFSEKQINEFYKTSNGFPGIINQLAVQALSDPAQVNKKQHNAVDFFTWIVNPIGAYSVSVLVVVMSIAYVLLSERNDTQKSIEVSLPSKVANTPDWLQSKEQVSIYANTKKHFELTQKDRVDESEKLKKNTELLSHDIPNPRTQIERGTSSTVQVDTAESQAMLKEIQAANKRRVSESQDDNRAGNINSIRKNVPAMDVTEKISIETEQARYSNSVQKIRGAEWLQKQPPHYYTLQLIGVHDAAILSELIDSSPSLTKKLSRFATINSGKPWYVLVYGSYKDRGAAIADIPTLPARIRQLKPWPRSIASIQNSIKFLN